MKYSLALIFSHNDNSEQLPSAGRNVKTDKLRFCIGAVDNKIMLSDCIRSHNAKIQAQQLLRLRRIGLALLTYLMVAAALIVADTFGFSRLKPLHWWTFIGLAGVGNTFFLIMIVSGGNLRLPDPSMTWLQIFYAGIVNVVVLYALPEMRPMVLMFFIPAFSFGMLRLPRRSYFSLAAWVMSFYGVILVLESAKRPDFDINYEIFLYSVFGIILTWFAFFGGFISDIRRRLKSQANTIQKANEEIRIEIEERKKAQIEKDRLIVELQDALSKVKTLSGLLPICSACKKIRDDKGYWNQIEAYISNYSDAEFSHSICPDCAQKLYPGIELKKNPQ